MLANSRLSQTGGSAGHARATSVDQTSSRGVDIGHRVQSFKKIGAVMHVGFGRQNSMGVVQPEKSIFHKKEVDANNGECSKIGARVIYQDPKYLIINSTKNSLLRNNKTHIVGQAIQKRLNMAQKNNPASDILWSKYINKGQEKSSREIRAVGVLKKKILSFSFNNRFSAAIKSNFNGDSQTQSMTNREFKQDVKSYTKGHSRNSNSKIVVISREDQIKSRDNSST